jgi:hypothetical protein
MITIFIPEASIRPVPLRFGLLSELKPPPWMKKNTGSLEFVVALAGAYTSRNRQSSDVVLTAGEAAVDMQMKPCCDTI